MLKEVKMNDKVNDLIDRSMVDGEIQNAKLRLVFWGILVILGIFTALFSKISNVATVIPMFGGILLLLIECLVVLIYYKRHHKYNSILGYIVTTVEMVSVTIAFLGFSWDNSIVTATSPLPWFYVLYIILTSRRLSFKNTIYAGVLAFVLYLSVVIFMAFPIYAANWTYSDGTGQYDSMNRLIVFTESGFQMGLTLPLAGPILKFVVICFATVACAISAKSSLVRISKLETLSVDQKALKNKFKSSVLGTIDEVSIASERISSFFNEISTSTDEMITTLKSIGKNSNVQNDSVKNGLDNIKKILDAFESIDESVAGQLTSLQNVSIKSMNITDGIKNITEISNETKESFANLIKWTIEGKKALESSTKAIEKISESSIYIMNLNKEINDISENTNVLSINAGIEAANAGSAGVGFTIVANQIRDLAKQTSEATKSVNIAIEEITERIKEGVKSSQRVERIFNNITESATYSDQKVVEINQSTDNQYKAKKLMDEYIDEVLNKMTDITEKVSDEKDHSQSVMDGATQVRALAQGTSTAIEQQIQAGLRILSSLKGMELVIEKNKNLVQRLETHLESESDQTSESKSVTEISM